jgi:hypothetical protein
MTSKKRMTKEELLNRLKFEQENGYPSFREEIIRLLNETYNIESISAEKLVWSKPISNKIMEDIEWAQHMGPNYWAKYIIEEYNHLLPKRVTKLALQL